MKWIRNSLVILMFVSGLPSYSVFGYSRFLDALKTLLHPTEEQSTAKKQAENNPFFVKFKNSSRGKKKTKVN